MYLTKYQQLEQAILVCLNTTSAITHKELFVLVEQHFKQNKIKFKGSLEWHLEWVKLDLESKRKITRTIGSNPIKFTLTN